MTESVPEHAAGPGDRWPIQTFVHEVNNPLTVALMRVALAKRHLGRDDLDREALVRGLGEAERQLRRVALLVAELEQANRHETAMRWPPTVRGGSHEADVWPRPATGAAGENARARWDEAAIPGVSPPPAGRFTVQGRRA